MRKVTFPSLLLQSLPLALLLFLFSCSDLSPVDEPLYICTDQGSSPPLPNRARFGFFAPELYTSFPGHLDSLSRIFGASPGYMLWFLQIDDPFPIEKVRYNAERGIATVISMNLASRSVAASRNEALLAEVNQGAWDAALSSFARAVAQSGVVVYLRFGYEMNGDWFPWGQKPEAYVAAWRRAHTLFGQAGASNVRWVFAPNVLYGAMTAERDLCPYYPGDGVVDVIGLDGYNFGDSFDRWHSWQSFNRIFGASLRSVGAYGKPVWITEVGCPSDERRPAWLSELFAFMDDNTCVEAVLWFNAHKTGEPDFRIESDSASLGLLRQWLAR